MRTRQGRFASARGTAGGWRRALGAGLMLAAAVVAPGGGREAGATVGSRPATPVATVAAAFPTAPAVPGQAEPLPDLVYGSAAVPAGQAATNVYNRSVTPSSLIFLSVDTTSWPASDLSLPGLQVTIRQPGMFQVAPIDKSKAPASGIPFTFAVFNTASTGFFTVGTGTIAAGQHNTGVSVPQATATSAVILTVDRQLTAPVGFLAPVPAIKLNNHGAGFITVTTVDNSSPTVPLTFNWMVVNETGVTATFVNGQLQRVPYSGCRSVCGTGTIGVNSFNVGVSNTAVTPPTGVLVTSDVTNYPSDVAVPGVKVNNHGSGFVTVTTDRLQPVPSTATKGLLFQYVLLQPPAQWEELGPTGRSGNTWAVAADPSDPLHTWYVGSQHGGVWKTTTGGNTWYQAWYDANHALLPEASIVALRFSPAGVLYAFDLAGGLYRSTDHGLTWGRRGPTLAVGNAYGRGLRLDVDSTDAVFGCSDNGLFVLPSGGSQWFPVGPTAVSTRKCTDVVVDGGTVYAAFRDVGVVRFVGGQWQTLKPAADGGDAPIRLAFNSGQIAVNDDCNVWLRNRTDLAAANVASTWGPAITGVNAGKVCDTGAGGYSLAVALSPNGHLVIASGRGGWESTDGGATFPTVVFAPKAGLDQQASGELHQILIIDDSDVVVALDGGIRLSRDGGATWNEADSRSKQVDGPPVTEFYNLAVTNPDQFGHVLLGGAVQDIGGIGLLDRPTGLTCCTAEFGTITAVPKPVDGSDASGNPTSTLRMVGTAYQSASDELPGSEGDVSATLDVCDFVTTGAVDPAPGTAQEGNSPPGNCHDARVFPAGTTETITAIGASQQSPTSILIGGSQGSVYRMHADSSTFDLVVPGAGDKITAIGFATDTLAFLGHGSGLVTRLTDPFGTHGLSTQAVNAAAGSPIASGQPVRQFAFHYGDDQELYVAYRNQVAATTNGGASWVPLLRTGTDEFGQDVASTDVVGLVRDPNHPTLFLALGHQQDPPSVAAWAPDDYRGGSVWRTPAPPSQLPTWTKFTDGLPTGAAVTGLGISPGKALYVSTQGRGVFWRRDVAAEKPNSGVNTPDHLTTTAGTTTTIVTRCSYPDGWRHIHTLDFKVARGHGAGDGAPVAAWLEFDQDRNVLRFYDPDTRAWTEGPPGSKTVLRSRYASLDLSRSKVGEVAGADPPTVEIDWALALRSPAAGHLQQFLRVQDDAGSATTWDKVGQWHVSRPHHRTAVAIVAALGGAAALAAAFFVLARRRRRRPIAGS